MSVFEEPSDFVSEFEETSGFALLSTELSYGTTLVSGVAVLPEQPASDIATSEPTSNMDILFFILSSLLLI